MKIHSVFFINISILIFCSPVFTQKNLPIEGLQNLEKARVYLVGERHDIIEKFDYQMQIIKHLHQNKNVDVIAFEHPHSYGLEVNKFFETGDSLAFISFLEKQKNSRNPSIYPKYQFFQQLFEYQNTLPKDQTLKLYFVDQEMYVDQALKTLIQLLKQTKDQEIQSHINSQNFDLNNFEKWDQIAHSLDSLIESNRSKIADNKQGDDIFSINEGLKVSHRDSFLYNNINQLLIEHPNSNVFAQFGTQHVRKNDTTSMAYFLNNDTSSHAFQSVFSLRLTFQEIENIPEYYKKKDDCPFTNQNICDKLSDIQITSPKIIYLKDFPELNEQLNGLLLCPKGSWGNILR